MRAPHSWRLGRPLGILITFILLLPACSTDTNRQSRLSPTPLGLRTTAQTTATPTVRPEQTSAGGHVLAPGATLVTSDAPTPQTSPTPTLTPIPGMIGPVFFPDNVNPLTGETVEDVTLLRRRPIAIKISNIARVRPQSGINNADIVFEHTSEGGITRFTAVYYSRDAEKVGSIRSARLIDLEIPVMYDAALGYSGSSAPIKAMIHDSFFFDRVVSPDFAHGGFYRLEDPENPGQKFEDTMFTDTYVLRAILQERGQDTPPQFENGMAFHPEAPPGGTPASKIEVVYGATSAFWYYDQNLKRYTRWSDGVPHLDASMGQQLNFKNIIVLQAHHQETEIIEDSNEARSIQIQIWGEGPASIFRDGQRYDGYWRRTKPAEMLSFYDQEGNILPLAPGNSFFELVPLGYERIYVEP
ncbi:MAG: DUF3048 domain-containing protein [Candidatus Promineifilaceae bacterium]